MTIAAPTHDAHKIPGGCSSLRAQVGGDDTCKVIGSGDDRLGSKHARQTNGATTTDSAQPLPHRLTKQRVVEGVQHVLRARGTGHARMAWGKCNGVSGGEGGGRSTSDDSNGNSSKLAGHAAWSFGVVRVFHRRWSTAARSMINHAWFDRVILMFIIANCVFLCMDDVHVVYGSEYWQVCHCTSVRSHLQLYPSV